MIFFFSNSIGDHQQIEQKEYLLENSIKTNASNLQKMIKRLIVKNDVHCYDDRTFSRESIFFLN